MICNSIDHRTSLFSPDQTVKVGNYDGVLLGTTPLTKREKRYVFNEFLTPGECECLLVFLAIYSSRLRPAEVLGGLKPEVRQAETMSLLPENSEKWHSEKIGLIVQKICTLAGHILNKSPESIKDLIEACELVKYTKNEGFFRPHHDDTSINRTRFRDLTILVYLNTVQEGGETYFPTDNTSITAEEGKLLCFNNHPEDAPNENCCLHQGVKPTSGHKFILAMNLMGDLKPRQENTCDSGRNSENPPALPPFPSPENTGQLSNPMNLKET